MLSENGKKEQLEAVWHETNITTLVPNLCFEIDLHQLSHYMYLMLDIFKQITFVIKKVVTTYISNYKQ